MSDGILQALMQLFAIVANTDEVGLKGREIVEQFLRRQLSRALVIQYLCVFDDFLEKLKGKSEEGKTRKRTSVNSVKVLRICTEINSELEQKQKVIVLIRLLEFVNASTEQVTDQHMEFIKTVSDTFGISDADYLNCWLISKTKEENIAYQSSRFLLIDHFQQSQGEYKHLFRENLSGRLIFLEITDPQFLVFVYQGDDQLIMDGRAITPNSVQVFEQGSVIRGAKLKTVYYNDIIHVFLDYNVSRDFEFTVDKLSYSFNRNKIGLHELSFTAQSKNFIAIMGNSGAGKTTLLNLLNGSIKSTSGKILVNGVDIYSNNMQLRGLVGNIPQDDLLVEELSVFQNLFFSSKLYFGNLGDEEITHKVNQTLKSLGLFEIRDLMVGDPLNKFISGGQRKRLNIALELIREPEILFVDEPTSGLSSNDAENVMDLLKQLSLAGKLIFVVIHQPSSEIYKLFDKLLLLDTGGYPVYYGNPVDAVSYFKKQMHYVDYENNECIECGNINPEEIFRIMELKTVDEYGKSTAQRKISATEWYALFNTETGGREEPEKTQTAGHELNKEVKLSGKLVQFLVYFQRNLFSKLNNRQYLAITLFEGPVLAFILAFALRSHHAGNEYMFGTNANVPVYMFICTIVALFLGLIVSADEIIQDKKILKRESFLQLSRNSYLLSKMTFLFLVSAVQTLLFLLIGNFILGFRELFLHYWMVLFAVSCFANLLGLNISSALKTRVAVYILIPFLVIPQIMLSGVMVKFEDLNPVVGSKCKVPLIGNVMVSRWAYEALAVDQFKNNQYESRLFNIEKRICDADYWKDNWVPKIQEQLSFAQNMNAGADSLKQLNTLLQHEFNKFGSEFPGIVPADIGKLSLIDSKKQFIDISNKTLDSITRFFIAEANSANNEKQALVNGMKMNLGVDGYLKFKNTYCNQRLDDMINEGNNSPVIVNEDHIARNYRPAFMASVNNGMLSEPFYTYSKSFFGKHIEAIWFNQLVIWLMSALLYVALYFDWLRKLLEIRKKPKF